MLKYFFLLLSVGLAVCSFRTGSHVPSKISPSSKITFSSKNASGSFDSISGTILFNEQALETCSFDIQINVSSINTGQKLKDKHARGKDWFDAAKYPLISFSSMGVRKTQIGFQTSGLLKIKDIEKMVTVNFTHANGRFKGKFEVRRTDFGIGSMKGMQKHVDEMIFVDFEIVVIP